MADLNAAIEALAAEFSRGILTALRGASLSDIVELTAGSKLATAKRATTERAAKKGRPRPGWPKCKTCGKNCHPRGKGYCWEHALAAGVVKGKGGPTRAQMARARRARLKAPKAAA